MGVMVVDNLYMLLNILKTLKSCRLRWIGLLAENGRGSYSVWSNEHAGEKRPVEKPMRKYADNFSLNVRDPGVAADRVVFRGFDAAVMGS